MLRARIISVLKMEEKSPYFSPKKTRNFVKMQRRPETSDTLKTTLLQKSVRGKKLPRKNVTEPVALPEIKVEPISPESKIRQSKDIKLETKRKEQQEPIPIEQNKLVKWEPNDWRQMLENIRQMRQTTSAPVDTMGCDQFKDDQQLPEKSRRFHTLVSLMLSSQTKDQVNFECMQRLRKHGLTPENVLVTDSDVLEKLIYPVSFYKNKTKYIRQASQILIDEYNGDIPDTLEGLLKLPGVGKKMAHLCMRSAWNVVTGIGVDTHVHRISNWLRWVPKETKTPEETRVALEKWLPFELWEEVNQLLVGFGQTTCTSSYPRCNECLNANICPAKGKHGIRKSPVKREIKQEDLEF
ncbi:endonuclease III-like protein 1 [Malaya genurostris]|uniref:endonuclease III-like protein 1 n=1 Tax=Malaya genurostris TaxID=325434 RepID=UPI0026F37DB8|nr:endonuclease III-like protein 1 [Malaya genurostris]